MPGASVFQENQGSPGCHPKKGCRILGGRCHRAGFGPCTGSGRTSSLCETVKGFGAIEIKASPRWEKRFNRGLHRVGDDIGKDRTACLGVCLGERSVLWDDVQVLPLVDFLKRPWAGEIIRVP